MTHKPFSHCENGLCGRHSPTSPLLRLTLSNRYGDLTVLGLPAPFLSLRTCHNGTRLRQKLRGALSLGISSVVDSSTTGFLLRDGPPTPKLTHQFWHLRPYGKSARLRPRLRFSYPPFVPLVAQTPEPSQKKRRKN